MCSFSWVKKVHIPTLIFCQQSGLLNAYMEMTRIRKRLFVFMLLMFLLWLLGNAQCMHNTLGKQNTTFYDISAQKTNLPYEKIMDLK